jgi:hypothetical protein
VTVAHAAEVNLVVRGMQGKKSMVNDVLPKTHCDLYSYSTYDSSLSEDAAPFKAALDYLKAKAPDSALFGADNVYVGEFGVPENDFTTARHVKIIKSNTETALAWGARYIVYWQLYCNEKRGEPKPGKIGNGDCRGFWLIRPDGSKSPVWDYFASLLKAK